MQIARIVTPFLMAVILFVFAYLTMDEGGYSSVIFLGIGIVLVIFGMYIITNSQKQNK